MRERDARSLILTHTRVVFTSVQVSSVEVVQAYIDRIQEVNPLLNAVVKDRWEGIIPPYLILYFDLLYVLYNSL